METEYSSSRLGLTRKRANWLVHCLVPFLGPLYAWSSVIQGKTGPMKLPVMVLGSRGGDRYRSRMWGSREQYP